MIIHHIFGMKRSGQHAIVRFIKNQYPGKVHFRNNSGPHRIPELKRNGDAAIISYEDHWLDVTMPGLIAYAGKHTEDTHHIWVCLRDPFNCFASRIRHDEVRRWMSPDKFVPLWVNHARKHLGTQVYQKALSYRLPWFPLTALPPVRHVLYDSWFSSAKYRRQFAESFGCKWNDEGRDTLSKAGSSFDEYDYKEIATQMQVLDRWKCYRENTNYLRMFTPEVLKLAAELFPDSSAWIDSNNPDGLYVRPWTN